MKFNVLYEVVKILSCIAEIYMVTDYYKAFHEFRGFYQQGYRRIIVAVTAVAVSVIINLANNNVLNMLTIPLIWMCILFVVFQGSIFSLIRKWLFVTIIMQSSEFIFAILQSIPTGLSTDQMFANNFIMVSSMIGVKLLSFILLLIVKQIPRSSEKRIEPKIFIAYILVPIATLGIMMCIPYIRKDSWSITATDVCLVLLYILLFIGNILLFFFFEQYNSGKERQMMQQIELTKYKEKQWHYNEIDRINKKHAVFIHNMNHYLKQIGAYAKKHETTEITKTLEELKVEFFANEQQNICANGLLNSLLIDFRERAMRKNIDINIFVECGFKIEFMNGIDIAAVFGNLLDNAIEAAEKCERGKIHLKLFMQNEGLFSVIRIQNSYIGQIKKKGEEILSSKEKGEHGIGLKNVREIIGKYHGYMINEYTNQVYTTIIVLPLGKE